MVRSALYLDVVDYQADNCLRGWFNGMGSASAGVGGSFFGAEEFTSRGVAFCGNILAFKNGNDR